MFARIDGLVGREFPTPVPRYPTFNFDGWLEQARHDLGIPNAQAVVSFPGQLKRARFYVNLLSVEGEPLGFAKISLDSKNDHCLVTETKALRYLAAQSRLSFRVPKILAEGKFNSHQYLVTEAMPAHARPIPAKWEPIPQRCRTELVESSHQTKRFKELSWWSEFLDKAGEVKPLVEAIKVEGDQEIEVCWAHGDFTHRNICCVQDEVWLFDWENSASDAPVMTDKVRFFSSARRRIVSRPADVAFALGQRFLTSGDKCRRRDLALALAFLCTRTQGGMTYGQYWDQIVRGGECNVDKL